MPFKRSFLNCFLFCFLFFLLSTAVLPRYYIPRKKIPDVHVYKKPQPTCVEKNYVELKKVKEVEEDLDAPAFLVKPCSIVADGDGNVFVMDLMFRKIYKYDKDLNFVKSFGGKGRGPAEFGDGLGGGTGMIQLYLSSDNLIYAGDRAGRKIICFDTDGNLVKEFRLNVKGFPFIFPKMDDKGNFYIHSRNNHVIDVYKRSGELKNSLLPQKILASGLFYKLRRPLNQLGVYGETSPDNCGFECLSDGRIIVLAKFSGIIYFLEDGKLTQKKFWPKHLLETYKKEFKEARGDEDSKYEGLISFYERLILDKDNEAFFYLPYGGVGKEIRSFIYQFDFNGGLKNVYFLVEPVKGYFTRFYYKRNGLFYCIGSDNNYNKTLKIYKEVEKK